MKFFNSYKNISYTHIILVFFIVVIIVLVSVITLFSLSHSTYIKYNDWWIVGNTIKNVQDRYGKFDRTYYEEFDGTFKDTGGTVGYFVYEDNRSIDPSHLDMYYWIQYNSDGIVERVYVRSLPGG